MLKEAERKSDRDFAKLIPEGLATPDNTFLVLEARATVAGGDSALMFTVRGGDEMAMNLYTSAGYHVIEEIRSIDFPG